jgi:hypothetical protein
MSVECFGQRLLNPFRGAVHTIRYEAAEAVTTDGVRWDIYVTDDELLDDGERRHRVQTSDIRYGSWSADAGLKRGPLYPSEDFLRMEEMGAIVFEYLTLVHRRIPFRFRDNRELWLLDRDRRPLALLGSATDTDELAHGASVEWVAGFAAQERFTSDALAHLGTNDGSRESAAGYLARYINTLAGTAPAAQWFRREADGGGTGLHGVALPPALEGRTLPAGAFPRFFLSERGHDEAHRRLIEDYHAWQAPWLLVLPHLDGATRRALEQQARRQALLVHKHYRLYPEFADEGEIKTALVEAVLRRSQGSPDRKDDALSTFCLELSPCTYE